MVERLLLAVLMIGLSGSVWAETAEEKGKAIAVEADKRESGFTDFTAQMKMELIDRKQRKTIRAMRQKTREVEADGDQAVVVFDLPKNIKGTALLTHSHIENDDQWLFLPKVGRVKRIASTNKSGSFMGSEFAYEDMASQEVDKYKNYRYLKDDRVDDLDCFVIERRPADEENSGYARQELWVDKAEYRIMKIKFYDLKNTHFKTLRFKNYNQYIGQFWRAGRMEMVNHVTGKSTNLLWDNYQFRVGLKAKEFRKKGLSRVR